MLVMISSMLLSVMFLFPLMLQPLSLGIVLLVGTVLVSLVVGMVMSSWFGYVLFLVYVGGLLVMFGYVAALMPNTIFLKGGEVEMGAVLFLFFFFFFFYELIGHSLGGVVESNFVSGYSGVSLFLYSWKGMCVVVGLGLVLLLALLCVIKVCYFHSGPLRPFV